MKFQAFLTFSALAFVTAQASAQTTETQHAAASPAVTAAKPAAPQPQLPPVQAAVDLRLSGTQSPSRARSNAQRRVSRSSR